MTFVSYSARELNFKLVYYGPAGAGKATNLQRLFDAASPSARSKMTSLATGTDRMLFFDFLPQWAEEIHGLRARTHLYAACGEVAHEAQRKLVLQGVDGVCFVADSRPERLGANMDCLEGLRAHLNEMGRDPDQVPIVYQYNKRDLPDAVPARQLSGLLNPGGKPEFEAIATAGAGVAETLEALTRIVTAAVDR
jgi:signal recognition particle receptor subunit beta